MTARLEAAAVGTGNQGRFGGGAVLEGNDCHRAVGNHHISNRVMSSRGHLRPGNIADRFDTTGKVQVANYLRSLLVDIWRNMMDKTLVPQVEHRSGVVSRGGDPHRIGGSARCPAPDAKVVASAVAVQVLLPVHVLRFAV